MSVILAILAGGESADIAAAASDEGQGKSFALGASSRPALYLPTPVDAVAWSGPLDRVATRDDWGRTIRVFDSNNKIITEIHGAYADISNSLLFIDGGRALVTPAIDQGSDVTNAMLDVWQIDTGRLDRRIAGPLSTETWQKNRARSLAISADQRFISAIAGAAFNNTFALYDVTHTRQIVTFPAERPGDGLNEFMSTDISPDGQWIAIGSARSQLVVLSTDKPDKPVMTVEAFPAPIAPIVTSIRFNPAGSLIAAGAGSIIVPGPAAHVANVPPLDHFVGIWEVPSGRLVASLPVDVTPVRQIAWSADGKYLAIAAGDGTLRVWEPMAGSPPKLATYRFGVPVVDLVWLGDDSTIAVASGSEVKFISLR